MMKKWIDIVWVALAIAIVGYTIFKITRQVFLDDLIGDNPQRLKAIIIDEKTFMGNQPVNEIFSYSYRFMVGGKVYTGSAHDSSMKIGDSVEVIYNPNNPSFNKPTDPKE